MYNNSVIWGCQWASVMPLVACVATAQCRQDSPSKKMEPWLHTDRKRTFKKRERGVTWRTMSFFMRIYKLEKKPACAGNKPRCIKLINHHDPKKNIPHFLEGASSGVCTLRFPWFFWVISSFLICFMFTLVIQFSCPHIFKMAENLKDGETRAEKWMAISGRRSGGAGLREGNFERGWTGKLRGCMGNILL